MFNINQFNNKIMKAMIVIHVLVCLVFALDEEIHLRFSPAKTGFARYGDFDLIYYENGIIAGPEGYPGLPVLTLLVVLPPEASDVTLTAKDLDWHAVNGEYNPHPVQPARPLSAIDDFVPPDENAYTSNQPYPTVPVTFKGLGHLGGFLIAKVMCIPFQYTASTKKLRFCEGLTLVLSYRLKASAIAKTAGQNRVYSSFVRSLVVNANHVESYAPPVSGRKTAPCMLPPGDYQEVYITSSPLVADFSNLVAWRHKQGIPCTTVTVSSITASYPGWDVPEKIRNFIKDANSSWATMYVTLAGDTGQIPTRIVANQLGASVATDLYFSDLDSTWDADNDHIYCELEDSAACDYYSDVFVGRLPVTTAAHVDNFLSKILTYEKDPAPGYLKKCLLPSSYLWAPYGGDIVNDSIANCTPAGWQDSKLYEKLGNVEHQITIDSLNKGFGFAHFAGHGNWNGIYWAGGVDTFIHNTDIPRLNNGSRVGVYNSIACFPGAFDMFNDSCLYSGDCLAENLINCTTGGAVAVIMNSRVGLGTPPYMGPSEKLDMEFYRKAFRENIYRVGQTHAFSKDAYVAAGDTASHYTFCIIELNLFGDPAMPMWLDEPVSMFVTHPDSIPTGPSQLNISVSDSRAPVANALVCLKSKKGEIYDYDRTNASGQVTFNINPTLADTMWVTATALNHRPDESIMKIYYTTQAADEQNASGSPDFAFLPFQPNPFNTRTKIEYIVARSSRVNLSVLNALGQNLGRLINERQNQGRHSLIWDGTINAQQLPNGIYFFKLTSDGRSIINKILIIK